MNIFIFQMRTESPKNRHLQTKLEKKEKKRKLYSLTVTEMNSGYTKKNIEPAGLISVLEHFFCKKTLNDRQFKRSQAKRKSMLSRCTLCFEDTKTFLKLNLIESCDHSVKHTHTHSLTHWFVLVFSKGQINPLDDFSIRKRPLTVRD